MQAVFVYLSIDDSEIVTAFAVQQNPEVTEIGVDDPRWKAYYDALPPQTQTGWPAPE